MIKLNTLELNLAFWYQRHCWCGHLYDIVIEVSTEKRLLSINMTQEFLLIPYLLSISTFNRVGTRYQVQCNLVTNLCHIARLVMSHFLNHISLDTPNMQPFFENWWIISLNVWMRFKPQCPKTHRHAFNDT